jgi:hypothetical protein
LSEEKKVRLKDPRIIEQLGVNLSFGCWISERGGPRGMKVCYKQTKK